MDWKLPLLGGVVFLAFLFFIATYSAGGEATPIDTAPPDEPQSTTMFQEDFADYNGENWATVSEPSTVLIDNDSALNCSDCDITTDYTFPSSNGISISFDVFLPLKKNSLIVYIRDKTQPSINYAQLDIQAFYDTINYWIRGSCVPTPQVETIAAPFDDGWHNIMFTAETDGTATWTIDGSTAMQRSNFMPGDYSVRMVGGKCLHPTLIDMSCSEILVDNLVVASLGQTPQDISCEVGGASVFKNPCAPGYCWSSGVCCPSSYPYYCYATDKCYASSAAATRASSACTSFRVVC